MARRDAYLDIAARERRAIELVRAGFRSAPVRLETGLSDRVIRALYHELHGRPPPPGRMKEAAHILARAHDREEATLFLWLYDWLNPEATRSADLDALLRSYHIYLDIRRQWVVDPAPVYVPGQLTGAALTVEEAWTLARAYCSRAVRLVTCAGEHAVPILVSDDVPAEACWKHCPMRCHAQDDTATPAGLGAGAQTSLEWAPA